MDKSATAFDKRAGFLKSVYWGMWLFVIGWEEVCRKIHILLLTCSGSEIDRLAAYAYDMGVP